MHSLKRQRGGWKSDAHGPLFLKWHISFLWLVVLFVLVLNTPMLYFFVHNCIVFCHFIILVY